MKAIVFTHFPPDNLCSLPLKLQPGSDIGFVVHVGNNNLVAGLKRAPDRQAEQAQKRCRIHAEGNLVRVAGVDQSATLSRDRAMTASTSMLRP